MSQAKAAEKVVQEIRRKTRRQFSAEEKIRIVLEGLRGEESIAALCRRHGLNRLPNRVGRRAVRTHRHAKQVPGHHVQVDVTFLKLIGKDGNTTRRYPYTAIDDATRIRALRVYRRHTQAIYAGLRHAARPVGASP